MDSKSTPANLKAKKYVQLPNENKEQDVQIQQRELPSSTQVGGTHYKDCAIQPSEYIHQNKLGWCEGNAVKYITRHNRKGQGKKDILKAIHYLELLLEYEYSED